MSSERVGKIDECRKLFKFKSKEEFMKREIKSVGLFLVVCVFLFPLVSAETIIEELPINVDPNSLDVAYSDDGSFVVVYDNDVDVYFSLFDESGNIVKTENVAQCENGVQRNPSVDISDENGEFVIAWQTKADKARSSGGHCSDIYAKIEVDGVSYKRGYDIAFRFFDSDGDPLQDEYVANELHDWNDLAGLGNTGSLMDTMKLIINTFGIEELDYFWGIGDEVDPVVSYVKPPSDISKFREAVIGFVGEEKFMGDRDGVYYVHVQISTDLDDYGVMHRGGGADLNYVADYLIGDVVPECEELSGLISLLPVEALTGLECNGAYRDEFSLVKGGDGSSKNLDHIRVDEYTFGSSSFDDRDVWVWNEEYEYDGDTMYRLVAGPTLVNSFGDHYYPQFSTPTTPVLADGHGREINSRITSIDKGLVVAWESSSRGEIELSVLTPASTTKDYEYFDEAYFWEGGSSSFEALEDAYYESWSSDRDHVAHKVLDGVAGRCYYLTGLDSLDNNNVLVSYVHFSKKDAGVDGGACPVYLSEATPTESKVAFLVYDLSTDTEIKDRPELGVVEDLSKIVASSNGDQFVIAYVSDLSDNELTVKLFNDEGKSEDFEVLSNLGAIVLTEDVAKISLTEDEKTESSKSLASIKSMGFAPGEEVSTALAWVFGIAGVLIMLGLGYWLFSRERPVSSKKKNTKRAGKKKKAKKRK
jgi:hypothetical protein